MSTPEEDDSNNTGSSELEKNAIHRINDYENPGLIDEDYDPETLRTEYVQAGEEARYRHTRMQNSYYLILVLNAAFIGAISGPYKSQNWELLSLGGGLAAVSIAFLAVTVYSNESKRGAAWKRRMFIERTADHNLFRLQRDTITKRAEFDFVDDLMVYDPDEKDRVERLHSSKIPYFFAANAYLWFFASCTAGWLFIFDSISL